MLSKFILEMYISGMVAMIIMGIVVAAKVIYDEFFIEKWHFR